MILSALGLILYQIFLIIWRQDQRKVKEAMALEVVTDDKNDKTEKNDKEYVHNKRTWDGTGVLFGVLPSFALTDNNSVTALGDPQSIFRPPQLVLNWRIPMLQKKST